MIARRAAVLPCRCSTHRSNLTLPVTAWSRSAPRVVARARMEFGDFKVFAINDTARLVLSQGDITKWDGDAIVNAAIHRAAGPELLEACRAIPEIRPGMRCPTGEARITPGFNLRAKHVIHTVGPIYESAPESAPLLTSAYAESLKLANQHGLKTIAFPAISTGVYGYPIQEAAEVSLKAVQTFIGNLEEVHFVLFGAPAFSAYVDHADKVFEEAVEDDDEEELEGEEEEEGGEEGRLGPLPEDEEHA